MDFHLYNVATREKERFKPFKQDLVRVYSCGPTVYWSPHIGNFSAYFMADTLVRTLNYLGYKTKWAMNITDVGHMTNDEVTADASGEDKMEKAAKRENITVWDIAKKYEAEFWNGYDDFQMIRPDIVSRATEHIDQMINLVKELEKNELAYETDDGVYFHVPAWKKYGEFSKLPMDQIMSGARIEINENKKDPRDFALWVKCVGKHADHTMNWDSPWGKGFPGWHIECSAMSLYYLGYNIDIHTGGVDHLFPHHECEIAQSEGALSKAKSKTNYFVKYWIHKAHIMLNGKKIAKSNGNVYLPKDLIEKGYSLRDIRYLMISVHYRTQQNFTFEALDQARNSLKRIDDFLKRLDEIANQTPSEDRLNKEIDDLVQDTNIEFIDYLCDDLNIPGCMSVIFDLISTVNKLVDNNLIAQKEAKFILDWFTTIDQVLNILPSKWEINTDKNIPNEVVELARSRKEKKDQKLWNEADEIREKIQSLGYTVIDKNDSYTIERI